MIWRSPGFPSLLVTYGVANDLFFSGHTALAVYGCLTLAQVRSRHRAALVTTGALVATFEIVVVLVLRAHYTMDVFAGAVAAFAVAGAADRLAPPVDRWVARLARGRANSPA
jgi:membrane-associated phospholipid phosphatase